MIRVADHSYESLKEALDHIPSDNDQEVIINLLGNTIHGQYEIDKPYITLINGTIENDYGAYEILSDGIKRGTFNTYTLFINADRVRLKNVTVLNSNGYKEGQAIALMVDGDDFKAEHCKISSYQDTLFIAPLPDQEFEKGGFRGPLENKERICRHTYFEDCLIEGSIDFIFGGGFAYFHNCEIRSRNIHKEINGYVFAPSTAEKEKYGFICEKCRFTSEEDMDSSVYLGRPWREYGKCLIAKSRIGSHIIADGYDDWGKDREHCEFKEYHNSGLTKGRVSWMKETDDEDINFIKTLSKEEK
ncbi:MAG: hypothetical protein IKD94_02930 [Erysipelotrichaceae bacterium]|nr:hypothetical protein [Erysipelotrichaceae bacterium]